MALKKDIKKTKKARILIIHQLGQGKRETYILLSVTFIQRSSEEGGLDNQAEETGNEGAA